MKKLTAKPTPKWIFTDIITYLWISLLNFNFNIFQWNLYSKISFLIYCIFSSIMWYFIITSFYINREVRIIRYTRLDNSVIYVIQNKHPLFDKWVDGYCYLSDFFLIITRYRYKCWFNTLGEAKKNLSYFNGSKPIKEVVYTEDDILEKEAEEIIKEYFEKKNRKMPYDAIDFIHKINKANKAQKKYNNTQANIDTEAYNQGFLDGVNHQRKISDSPF